MEYFIANCYKNRPQNAIQKLTGYESTSFEKGEIQMGKLASKKHLFHILKEEATNRGISVDSNIKVKALKIALWNTS